MKDWTFGKKTAVGFSVLGVLSIVASLMSYSMIEHAVATKDHLIEVEAAELVEAVELELTAARADSALRGYLLGGDEALIEEMHHEAEIFSKILATLERQVKESDDRTGIDLVAAIAKAEKDHEHALEKVFTARQAHTGRATVDLFVRMEKQFAAEVLPRFAKLDEAVVKFRKHGEARMLDLEHQSDAEAHAAEQVIIGASVLVFMGLLLLGTYLTRSVKTHIGGATQDLATASQELQAAATQQSSASTEQAATITEAVTTMKELMTTARQIEESAGHVAQMASECQEAGRSGGKVVNEGQAAMKEITKQIDEIVVQILALGEKSQQIGSILDLVNELAEQTNILSVNATIEAAGAGDSGSRFSAVAAEIRKLSERVGDSTREIRTLVDAIRSSVNASVMATETGQKTVASGAERFEAVSGAFTRSNELIQNVSQAGKEIALATRQQATAMEQLGTAFGDSQQAATETEASARQTSQTASELASLSTKLLSVVQEDAER